MKAVIFDIQNTSYVDGPGIRTVIFFKGCNMRCKWCHNPEGFYPNPQLLYFKQKCIGCGRCRNVCKRNGCIQCGSCAEICPSDARKMCGDIFSLEFVFAKIKKEKAFFDASGGGVTCSGGECMLQLSFLCELLKMCKREGIHTAVDTAGNVAWIDFEKIIPYTDQFLFDIKCISPELHKLSTGTDNALILDNYKHLIKRSKVCVRIPIVNNFNSDENELTKISEFINRYPPDSMEVLPYHNLGKHKYEAIGIKGDDFGELSKESLKRAYQINIFNNKNINDRGDKYN